MRVRVSHITRKAKGGIVYRDEDFYSDTVRFGRSTDNEVHLPDPRVNLQQAGLATRAGGVFIESVGNATIRHNGAPKSSTVLSLGDTIGLGPYDLVVAETPEEF
ncbi:MAG: FHA domain-containing protein, partial [Proteobacteria bacterium]|nr:FHA domain-containing protein [Pseudomonadota bacterium]